MNIYSKRASFEKTCIIDNASSEIGGYFTGCCVFKKIMGIDHGTVG